MTKEQVLAKVREMYTSDKEFIMEQVVRKLASGCVDLSEYEDDYSLPKMMYVSALKDLVINRRTLEMQRRTQSNIDKF